MNQSTTSIQNCLSKRSSLLGGTSYPTSLDEAVATVGLCINNYRRLYTISFVLDLNLSTAAKTSSTDLPIIMEGY